MLEDRGTNTPPHQARRPADSNAHPSNSGPREKSQDPQRRPRRNFHQGPQNEEKTSAGYTPGCMRPCQELLDPAPKTPEERSKLRFNGRKGGPPGHRPPQPPREQKRPDGRVVRQPFDGLAHLYEVIQVRLVRTQRLVEVNTNDFHLMPGTSVLVRVHRNILLATTTGYRYRRVAEINSLPFVVRIATPEDQALDNENAIIEKRAQALATGFAIENNLQMKVLSADLSHDHRNITINFASDVRVDFRNMVAFLAGQLKLRVEMYQLGLRNGTGLICGLGSCGQLLCCGRFLGQFDPIAVRQLRAQGLAANPKRISGVCGRLYCCMSYEYCDYMKEQKSLPRKGKRVFTRWGIGRVTDIDSLREDFFVTYENGETQRITTHDYLPVTDEIVEKIEKGEIEFPLEPARFYLNHDPSSACEIETRTQTKPAHQMPHSRPRHIEASVKRRVPAIEHEKIRHPDAQAAGTVTKIRKTRPVAKSGDPERTRGTARPVPARAARNVSQQQPANAQSTERVRGAQHPVRPADSAAAPASPASSHLARMPRKVKAHQANLEESAAANAESRHVPARTSRRRFNAPGNPNAPKPPQNPNAPKPPAPTGQK